MTQKPPTILEIHFDGGQIYPEKVPHHTLANALTAVQSLVTGDNDPEDSLANNPTHGIDSLRLVGVRRGSAIYQVSGPRPQTAQANLKAVGLVIDHPDEAEPGNDYILNPVKNLSTIARRLGCEITIRGPGSRKAPGAVLARIGPVSYESLSKSLLIFGETTIFGRVERVGGATAARCGLRVPFQDRMFVCKVANAEVARRIGTWLYQDVTVSGAAQWLKHSFRLFSFTIRAVSRPDQGSILGAMEALRGAGGDAWDSIADPDAYLEEVRRDL